jgi:methylmalonyl-CoA carboxyltransferase 12S subunit
MAKLEYKSLEAELEALRERVEKLEALVAAATKAATAADGSNGVKPPPKQEISTEIIIAISAAVAAFLGKRASIRQIRLTGETPWAQQGRATVQASHGIEFVRGLR